MPRMSQVTDQVQVGVYSFGDKCAKQPVSQFEFNVSKLRDPAGQKQFSSLSGVAPEVRDWVSADLRVAGIVADCRILANDLLTPKPVSDGIKTEVRATSKWVSFSFRDIHGKWISPAVAELVADALSKDGFNVTVTHWGLREVAEDAHKPL